MRPTLRAATLRRPTRRLVLALGACALVLLGTTLALRSLQADDAQVERSFTNRDKDGDGKLSPEEVGDAALFTRLDANQDGAVSLEEAKAFFNRPPAEAPAAAPAPQTREQQIEQEFQRRDQDGDGKLSPAEIGNQQLFEGMDTDKDGFASLAEVKAVLLRPGNTIGRPLVGPDQSFTPLTDLGPGEYQGFPGGLYPDGTSTPPQPYGLQGLTAAAAIQPRNAAGEPAPDGRVVLLSIGMSNTTQEFSVFKTLADQDPAKHPLLTIVDGAQGGQDSVRVKDPAAPFWTEVDRRLAAAGVTGPQVQVVWLKEATIGPSRPFPLDAQALQADLAAIVEILTGRFANLKIIYVSSRTYGGHATTNLNPEPYAYQSGFAVKWLIEERIKQETPGPWVAWGPYLWTDGTRGRRDGLVWLPEDVTADGTHPSPSGRLKVANLLLDFFKTAPSAQPWFLAEPPLP